MAKKRPVRPSERKRRPRTARPASEVPHASPRRRPTKMGGYKGVRRPRVSRDLPQDSIRPEGLRLQRVLAAAGYGSRRSCEQFIVDGRVEVDGKVVTELGTRVNLHAQIVRVDGVQIKRPQLKVFVLNKPPGVLSTNRDPSGRTRVIDLVPHGEKFFAVGRLDRASEGLILITNDGDLANRLAHPRYEVEKTYRVEIAGLPSDEAMQALKAGIHLAEGPVRPAYVRVVSKRKQSTTLEIVLTEGRNREIRRMAARIGHKVMKLRRIAIGPLRLGDLPLGAHRELTKSEIEGLRKWYNRRPQVARAVESTEVPPAGGASDKPRVGGERPRKPFPRKPFPRKSSGGPRPGSRAGKPKFPRKGKPQKPSRGR